MKMAWWNHTCFPFVQNKYLRATSEEEIFAYLGLEYIPPSERNAWSGLISCYTACKQELEGRINASVGRAWSCCVTTKEILYDWTQRWHPLSWLKSSYYMNTEFYLLMKSTDQNWTCLVFLINVKFITERVKTNLASSHSVISEILQTFYLHIIYEFVGHSIKTHTNSWYAIRNIWL